MTPKQFRDLPVCFQEKIKIDKDLKAFRSNSILDFIHGGKLLRLQETYRLRCMAHIKRARGGNPTNLNMA